MAREIEARNVKREHEIGGGAYSAEVLPALAESGTATRRERGAGGAAEERREERRKKTKTKKKTKNSTSKLSLLSY